MTFNAITPKQIPLTIDQQVAIEMSITQLSSLLQRLTDSYADEFIPTQNLPMEYRLATIQQTVRLIDVLQGIWADGAIAHEYVSPSEMTGRVAAMSFASSNSHKIAEFNAFCKYNAVLGDIIDNLIDVSPPSADVLTFPDENINSFIENSREKAIFASERFPHNNFVISEDSGIVVPSIGAEARVSSNPLYGMNSVLFPGVVSARFGHIDTLTPLLSNLQNGKQVLADCVATDETSTEINNVTLYELVTRHGELVMTGERKPMAILNTFASVAKNGELIAESHGSLVGEISANENVVNRGAAMFDGHGYNPIFFVPTYNDFLSDISLARRVNFDHRSQAFVASITSMLLSLKVKK